MKSIVLLYDESLKEEVENTIQPLFGADLKLILPFNNDIRIELNEEDFIVTFLSDEQLKEFFPIALKRNWKIGFLPHPKMVHARRGFGVDQTLSIAIENILAVEESTEVDVLMANGRPVFNTVVIGESLSLMAENVYQHFFKRFLTRLKNFFNLFKNVRPQWFSIRVKNKETLDTAAVGMLVVQHSISNLLSRRIIEEAYINDGKMHIIILSPKSITELMWFGVSSFFRTRGRGKLPPFAAHIKTDCVYFESKRPIEYTHDGALMSTKELELEVKPKAIKIITGKHLETPGISQEQEIYKIRVLPRGEMRDELVNGPLPFIYHASTEEFKWLFTVLRENAKTTNNYLVLMVISTFIATLGLFGNSSPVIIGAMILAPLMAPIISLSMGVLRQDQRLIQQSAKAIGLGMFLGYICAVVLTWVTPLNTSNEEILARIRPNLLDLGVAVGSGVAGAFAHAKEEIAKTLAGVAIAVALVPPLAVSGIGLGWMDWEVFVGAFLLLITNLAGMVLAAALTFLFLGFSPFRLARKGLFYSLMTVFLISLPLVIGFLDMVKEKNIIAKLNGYRIENAVLREIQVRKITPLRLSVKIVSESPLDEDQIRAIKKLIEDRLNEEVELEVVVGLQIM